MFFFQRHLKSFYSLISCMKCIFHSLHDKNLIKKVSQMKKIGIKKLGLKKLFLMKIFFLLWKLRTAMDFSSFYAVISR